MIESAVLLLMNGLLLMLRLSGGDHFPPTLSKDEEAECLERWQNGDIEARNTLVEHNLRLVAHIIKKYYTAEDMDDLISIGTIGLIKGINTYKNDKNVRLATYCSRCIENEILMFFRKGRRSSQDVSLSDALDVDGENDNLSIMDVVAVEDDMAERLGSRELCGRLGEYIDKNLTEREARVIRARYGIGGGRPLTQAETAKSLDISRSYVSRIEKKALNKLREALTRDGVDGST